MTGLPRLLAALIRDRVCEMTGLQRERYYSYLALNRLAPAVRAQARGLTERRLRPVVAVPPARQLEVLVFAEQHALSDQALMTLTRVIRTGDEDEVQRIMARLRQERARHAGRTAITWEGLLNAVPADYEPRLAALTAELAALAPERRPARLDQVRQQLPRLRALAAAFDEILVRSRWEADEPTDG